MVELERTIKKLQIIRDSLDTQRRDMEYRLSKIDAEIAQLEPQIIERFNTTDIAQLEKRLGEIQAKANDLIAEIELSKILD